MKNRIYSIYDKDLDKFAPLFVADDDKTAARMFYISISQYPEQVLRNVELWSLGEIDITLDDVIYNKYGSCVANYDSYMKEWYIDKEKK